MSHFLEFNGVSKRFGQVRAVDRVSFGVKAGEFFSLLGPSGCGKTTLLRLLAGFEQPDSGRLLLDGVDITALPPHKRPVNTVFQNYALFPHLTVRQNIAFGPNVAGWPKDQTESAVAAMLALTQLQTQADRRPTQLSGGQKQRVAIARALINKPRVLLLDEPLAALDLKLRQHMLLELNRIHDEVGITFLYVTHDQTEAMSLSDRMAVMNHGRVEQLGAPPEVYDDPATGFVASFIGDTNFLDGRVTKLSGGRCLVRVEELAEFECRNHADRHPGDRVRLSIRPEKLRLGRYQPPESLNAFQARIEDVIYMGSQTRYRVRINGWQLTIAHSLDQAGQKPPGRGETIWAWFNADDGRLLEPSAEGDAGHA
jgi:spermidine/putrescine transport system ATP-binding protein